MDTLESLRALRAQGVINAAEFVSLASEIAKAQAAPQSVLRVSNYPHCRHRLWPRRLH